MYNYNKFKGEVDLSDQLLQYYQAMHKYWKTHCVNISVTKAYILFKEGHPVRFTHNTVLSSSDL